MSCRFFGGPAEGRVRDLDLVGLGYVIEIPETDPLFREHWRDEVQLPFPRITSYAWDGTVTETGERRMRWSGRFI